MEHCTRKCLPEVRLGSDMMSAQLKLQLNEEGQEYNLSELKQLLKTHGVKTGIIEEAIDKMITYSIYGVFVEVAKGKEATRGKDGYFIYHVQESKAETGPKILENGEVEYVHTNSYTIVEEGDLLAEYVPATNGEYGYTVDSKMLAPQKGSELSPLRGTGFRIENGKYYAKLHGKLEINEVGMQITNLLEVKGDVDIAYGHIDFDGDVSIRGDVHSGMEVKAKGNIEIKGHVGDCQIQAGKNITIGHGMQGKLTGKLTAGEDITCKFFESAQAFAGGNIYVSRVLNSKLEAEGHIKVEGRGAVILGGSVHAIQGIEVTEAGNEKEIPTVLAAGVFPQMIKRNTELDGLIHKVEDEVALLDKAAGVMQRMMQTKVAKETADRRMKIIQAKVIKSTELKKYKDEKVRTEALIESGKGADVVVQNIIYPGCRVEIAGTRILVKEQIKHAKFLFKEGRVDVALLY